MISFSSQQVKGATPALCCVCKADLKASEVRDSEHTLQGVAAGQSVCGVGAAEWPDVGMQESELKCEELESSTSVHLYTDSNPSESHSSPHNPLNTENGEEQHTEHAIHTPQMMCSVTLVDCRAMVELNGNVPQEEHLNDGSVHAEEPEEPAEPDEANDDFCPSG